MLTRRDFIAGVTTAATVGCSSPSGTDGGLTDAPLTDGMMPPPPPPPRGKYLFQQPLLFQRAHAKSVPFEFTNSRGEHVALPELDFVFDGTQGSGSQFGSNWEHLCVATRRNWRNEGGDWLDASGASQGTTPFARSEMLMPDAPEGTLEIDVTSAVQWMFEHQHWCAFFVRAGGSGGEIQVAGALGTTIARPTLRLTFPEGEETADAWYVSSITASTAYSNAQADVVRFADGAPLLLEFYRASAPGVRITEDTRTPTAARLVVPHSALGGGALELQVFVVDPQVPASLDPAPGLAAAYPLDAGIAEHAAVCAALCVLDDTTGAEVIDEERTGTVSNPWVPTSAPYGNRSEATMDPYLWTPTPGTGDFAGVPAPSEAERDLLFPRRVHGPRATKLVGNVSRAYGDLTNDALRVIRGDDALAATRGFTPLAPGLGALEIMYSGGRVANGQSTFAGTTGGHDVDLDMWFREEHIGRVVDGYMRMYVLLGSGWEPSESGLSWQFHVPATSIDDLGKYPEQLGMDPATITTWRRLDRTGKFPGGIQQQTSAHTAMLDYVDPTRVTSSERVVRSAGGAYSSSSGIHGYQGRWMFAQGYHQPGTPGPAVGGMSLGIELYDFNGGAAVTIPSQNGLGGWDASWRSFATQVGGLGFFYPQKWYCVEMRWRMNTTRPYELPPVGTHWLEGGHDVDGYIGWWVDGLPAGQSPLFAHRSSAAIVDWALQNGEGRPFDTDIASPGYLRGISNVPPELFMGAASAVFNAYYGGRTYNDSDKFVYLNGIVCSNGEYIGPMAGVSRDNGGLG